MYRFDGQCDSTIGWGITYAAVDIPEQEPFLDIYPNPVTDKLYLHWQEGFNFVKGMQFHLYNTVGLLIKTIPINDRETKIDLHGLVDGLDLYTIRKEGHLIQKGKIVKY